MKKECTAYVQARLPEGLYKRAAVQLVMRRESWQTLIRCLIEDWTQKQEKSNDPLNIRAPGSVAQKRK